MQKMKHLNILSLEQCFNDFEGNVTAFIDFIDVSAVNSLCICITKKNKNVGKTGIV